MEDTNKFESIIKLIDSAKSVITILPPDPSKDLVSAAVSLHLSLKESGKNSQIGCGSEVHVDSKISGVSEISDSIGSRNLVISFDYSEENLDKVDYDVRKDGRFYLLVKPKTNAPVPDISSVKYAYSGAEADLVITMGVLSLEELGKIYAEEKNFLDEVTTISLNISARPAAFTQNTFHEQTSSFTELVARLLEKSNLKASSSAANNLLEGIYDSTSKLTSSKMSADTFSSIAYLMRSGARLPNQQIYVPKFSQPPFFEVPLGEPQEDIPDITEPVPSDWKKPKIFRAGDL